MAHYGSKAYSLFRWNHISMFWTTVCKTVRSMLSDHCLFVCNIGVLRSNGSMTLE